MSTASGSKAAAAPPGRRRSPRLSGRDRAMLFGMGAVPAIVHVTFVWIPAISTVLLSFCKWDGIGGLGKIKWIGLENYRRVFRDETFWHALWHNVAWLIFLFLIPTMLGLFVAYLLDKNLAGHRIYQSIFYAPVVLSLAIVGFIWSNLMYSPEQGLINSVLHRTAQGNQIDWIGDSSLIPLLGIPKNLAAILVAAAWRHTGYVMVLYLAGLKSVDPSLKEAAAIDGANAWQTFRRVVFPAMKPINIVVLVITVIESLRAFDIVYIVNKGRNGLELLSVLVTNNLLGEGGGQVGLGSAYGVVLLVLCAGFIIWYVSSSFRDDAR
jgi:multiple sugar transport system permease protein